MSETEELLSKYNGLLKENDELYRNAAKAMALSDCTFWILYSLRDSGTEITQSDLGTTLYLPKQTINSALKKLESDGFIELLAGNDRRSKRIRLTEKGTLLAEQTADHVISAELEALNGLTNRERETFIDLFQKYTVLLKQNMQQLISKYSEERNLDRK